MLARPATFAPPVGDAEIPSERPSYALSCCAPSFVKSLFNMREICCPMSFKKMAYWTAVGGAVTGAVMLEHNYGILTSAATFRNDGFMAAIYLFEPVIQCINIVLAKYDKAAVVEPDVTEIEDFIADEFSDEDSPWDESEEVHGDNTPLIASVDGMSRERNARVPRHVFVKKMKSMMREMQDLVTEIKDTQVAVIQTPKHEHFHAVPEHRISISLSMPDHVIDIRPSLMPEADFLDVKESADNATSSDGDNDAVMLPRVSHAKGDDSDGESVVVQDMLESDEHDKVGDEKPLLSMPQEVHASDVSPQVFMRKQRNKDVAIIISCHTSVGVIAETIASCLWHVEPEQVFVVDNGNSLVPLDETRAVLQAIDPKINYIWGHYGNKTIAQYFGGVHAKYKYALAIDDDSPLPYVLDFAACGAQINDQVKAICFPIRAIHPKKEGSLLIELQDMEYQFSDMAKMVQSQYAGSVPTAHGAACFWDIKVFLEVLRQHDTVFYAEDLKQGLILQKMGYTMKFVGGSWFDTKAPTSLFGETPNLYEQRVRSWEMGRQVYFFKILWQLISVWRSTFTENCILKLSQFYDVYTNLSDWWRLPLLVIMGNDPDFWSRVVEFYAFNIIPALAWNYLKLPLSERKDLQVPLRACLALPVYKAISSAMSFGGAVRAVTIYLPNFRTKPMIGEIEKLETQDREKLEAEIKAQPVDGPVTYKNILYDRFFKPQPANAEPALPVSANKPAELSPARFGDSLFGRYSASQAMKKSQSDFRPSEYGRGEDFEVSRSLSVSPASF